MDLVLKIGLQLLVGIAASDDFDTVVFFVLDVEFLDELWTPIGHEGSLEEGVGGFYYSRSITLHVVDDLLDQSGELSTLEEKWGVVDEEALVHSNEIIEEERVLFDLIAVTEMVWANLTE